ncbi:MAG: tRNA (guanosine(18)-2'-O)-methyltransferase TrmH [Spirulinaceae cyanobacterium]
MIPRRYQKLRQVLNKRQPDLAVLMENVHKPHNFSAILRTCDAVGVFEAHVVNRDHEMPTYNSTARGSEKWINLHLHDSIGDSIKHLKDKGFHIYAAHLSDRSVDYRKLDYTQPTAILMGSERWGVSEEAVNLVDKEIIIPMVGMVQSLNVSVAAAVILFEVQRQRLQAGLYDKVQLDSQTYERVLFEWGYPQIAARHQQEGTSYPLLDEKGLFDD